MFNRKLRKQIKTLNEKIQVLEATNAELINEINSLQAEINRRDKKISMMEKLMKGFGVR